MAGERGGGRRGDLGREGRKGIFCLEKKKQGESGWERARACEAKGGRCCGSMMEWGRIGEDAGVGARTSSKREGEKLEPLPPPRAGSDPVDLLRGWSAAVAVLGACGHLPGGNTAWTGQSEVPRAHRAPRARRQWVLGKGRGGGGGGGEEDFSSKLNLLENLACSPSS